MTVLAIVVAIYAAVGWFTGFSLAVGLGYKNSPPPKKAYWAGLFNPTCLGVAALGVLVGTPLLLYIYASVLKDHFTE